MPDLFRKTPQAAAAGSGDPAAPGAPGPDMAMMAAGGGGGGRRRGKKAKTGLSAMLLGVNTMYDTSSSSYEDDDDE